jgi:predicted acetyltransferase
MLHDARALQRKPRDRTWLRLIDVPKALSSRTYAQEGEIVFEVRDQFCPWNEGVYHLVGGPSGATCIPTTKSPDLTLSVDDLAVPYLGGSPFTPLARAGRVQVRTPGALPRADAMFATQLKPWSPMLT